MERVQIALNKAEAAMLDKMCEANRRYGRLPSRQDMLREALYRCAEHYKIPTPEQQEPES